MYECLRECVCYLYMCRHTCKDAFSHNRKPNLTNNDHKHKNTKYVFKIPGKKETSLGFLSNSQIQQEPNFFQTFYSTILSPRDFCPEDSPHGTMIARVAPIINTTSKARSRRWSVPQRMSSLCGHSF